MEVIKINPRGYCQGVTRALDIVKNAVKNHHSEAIYLLGMIVHNQLINQALTLENVKLLDDSKTKEQWIDEITDGVIIISAHGVNPSLITKAKEKGLTVIDATCKYVNIAQNLVVEYLSNGYDVLYIGEKNHPEAQGIITINENKIHLINDSSNLDDLVIINDKIMVTTQTTMNYQSISSLFDRILAIFPSAIILDEICTATRMRQQAVYSLKKQVDLLLVVGDKSSNNAKKLLEIGVMKNISLVKLIGCIKDLQDFDLTDIESVAITSAASTPTYLTNQVIEYLEKYPDGEIVEYNLKEIL